MASARSIPTRGWKRWRPISPRHTARGSALDRFPELDILVNSLGIYEPRPFEEITDADWQRLIEANFMSGVRLARHHLPRMKAKGWGRILFISSESAVNIPVEMIHYGVTKTMQVALARGLAETTAGTAVTVNSILAGPTRSEGVEGFIREMADAQGIDAETVEREFFRARPPLAAAAVRGASGGGAARGVRREPVGFGHQRRRAARRRRRRPLDPVSVGGVAARKARASLRGANGAR